MAQDMNDPNFKKLCNDLWEDFAPHTTIDRFHEKIAVHEKSVFLGYADITLGFLTRCGHIVQWKLRGVEVKMLNGKSHLDMPSDKGADGNYYPQFFPKTPADRVVLTTMVFSAPGIIASVENAAKLIEAGNQSETASEEVAASVDASEIDPNSVGAKTANPFA
jgi:hypothetical protein